MVEEPESRYSSHVTPKQGTGLGVAKALYSKMKEMKAVDSLKVIGGDGTNVNVGWKTGAMAYLEKFKGQPLQRQICLLHGIDLPFRAAVKKYVGKTSGPNTFSGPLNDELHDPKLTDRPIVKFRKIITNGYECSEEVRKELSTDQLYLLDISRGIISGKVDDDLAARQHGTLGHVRWNTTASAVCRLYASTKNPSKELKAIINIVIKFYGKIWFYVKQHSKCTDGPKNLFRMIELLRDLPWEDQQIMRKSIQHNAHYAHSENILLTMLTDEDKSIREQAVSTILKIRSENAAKPVPESVIVEEDCDDIQIASESEPEEIEGEDDLPTPKIYPVHSFKVPELNFDATTYTEMNSRKKDVFEPPLTLELSSTRLRQCIEDPLFVPNYPCHTQMVERTVKMVTEASSAVYGPEARDGFIRQQIKSRTIVPKFESKKDAIPLLD